MSRLINIALRSAHELLPLGTRVTYHHRAAPARHQRAWKPHEDLPAAEIPRGWKLKEGLYKDELIPKGMGEGVAEKWYSAPDAEYVVIDRRSEPYEIEDKSFNLKDAFFNWPRAHNGTTWYTDPKLGRYNKTVFVWPASGSGIIMGIIKRGIGISSSSYYSRNYWGEGDYEQGYLQTDMYVDLYAVKERYEGTEYILCPLWAVKEEDAGTA